eukprot:c25764_g1_i1 orf=49-447(-)
MTFLRRLFPGCCGVAANSDVVNAGWSKPPKVAYKSKATVLVNKTNKTLVLRDKISVGYGKIRYTLPKNSSTLVSSVSHTFYRMLAYAIEEHQENGSEVQVTDTKLSVDSEELSDYSKITVYMEDEKYKLDLE